MFATILDGHSDLVTICLALVLLIVVIIVGRIVISIINKA